MKVSSVALAYSLVFAIQPLSGQSRVQGKTETDCRAEVRKLNAEIKRLREQLATKSESPVEKATTPEIADAVKAIRAVRSVMGAGSILDIRRYYLDAKVKVDALPETETTRSVKLTVDILADLVDLLERSKVYSGITARRYLPNVYVSSPLITKYNSFDGEIPLKDYEIGGRVASGPEAEKLRHYDGEAVFAFLLRKLDQHLAALP